MKINYPLSHLSALLVPTLAGLALAAASLSSGCGDAAFADEIYDITCVSRSVSVPGVTAWECWGERGTFTVLKSGSSIAVAP